MSATMTDDGLLNLFGSPDDDRIRVTATSEPGQVIVDGSGEFAVPEVFDNVQLIYINTGDGDDVINVDKGLLNANAEAMRVAVLAGEGDDRIRTGFGSDTIYGGGGNDYIYYLDYLFEHSDRDITTRNGIFEYSLGNQELLNNSSLEILHLY